MKTTTSASIGTAIIALSDPHRGSELRYNRWYEDDHVYSAAMAGPGVISHGRWVAPADFKKLRPRARLLGDPSRGSYLLTFWVLEGMQEEWNKWIERQQGVLEKLDRWRFPPDDAKDHIYTGVYRFLWESRDEFGPLAVVAHDRCFPWIIAIAIERSPGYDLEAVKRWTDSLIGETISVVAALEPEQLFKSVLDNPPDPNKEKFLFFLAFCNGDVSKVWKQKIEPSFSKITAIRGVNGIGFASPFLRTIPGTDCYVDELWL